MAVAAGAAALIVFTVLCYYVSRTTTSISDAANNALQGWDMLHGNVLLHGWIIGDATYVTLELPVFALTEAFTGLGPAAMHVEPALTYGLIALVGGLLAVQGRSGRDAAARFLTVLMVLAAPLSDAIAAPAQRFSGGIGAAVLLEEPDHIGTAALILLAFLVAARWAERRFGPVLLLAVLALSQLGDETVRYVGVGALAVVCAARIIRARTLRCPDSWLLAASIASVPAAILLRDAVRAMGGYSMAPPNASIASPSTWPGHLKIIAHTLLYFFGVVHWPHWTAPAVASLAVGALAFAAAAFGFLRVAVRWFAADRADQLLVAGVVLNLLAYMAYVFVSMKSSREMAAVLPLLAVLAARGLPTGFLHERLKLSARPLAAVAAVAALIPLATGATHPVVVPRDQSLVDWLEAHHQTYGLATYWEASEVTVLSSDRVKVRSIQPGSAPFQGSAWEGKSDWYDPKQNVATFIIANTDAQRGKVLPAAVIAAYGLPTEVGFVPGCEIFVYAHQNLLDKVQPPTPPDN